MLCNVLAFYYIITVVDGDKNFCFTLLRREQRVSNHNFQKMIVNINYKGQLAPGELAKIDFQTKIKPPVQKVLKTSFGGSMLVFPSGKFRLMGVKNPLTSYENLPLLPATMTLQSCTITGNYGDRIHLSTLANDLTSRRCTYEPELFPAARLLDFNPLCVNVFSTGKIVILGVKDLDGHEELLTKVFAVITFALF